MNNINNAIIFVSKPLIEGEVIDFINQLENQLVDPGNNSHLNLSKSHISFLQYLGDFPLCIIIYYSEDIIITSEQIAYQLCKHFEVNVMIEKNNRTTDYEFIIRTPDDKTFFAIIHDPDSESIRIKTTENVLNTDEFCQYHNIISKASDLYIEFNDDKEVCNIYNKSKNADILINAPALHYSVLHQLLLINGAGYRKFSF
jgi:hypothetical protein